MCLLSHEEELADIDSRPEDFYDGPDDAAMAVRRRRQIAEGLEIFKQDTYTAYSYCMSTLNEIKTIKDYLLQCTPSPDFLQEFINYGETGLPKGMVDFNHIKTHLLPEALESLGFNPELEQLLQQDIDRVQGIPVLESHVHIEEIVDFDKALPTVPGIRKQSSVSDSAESLSEDDISLGVRSSELQNLEFVQQATPLSLESFQNSGTLGQALLKLDHMFANTTAFSKPELMGDFMALDDESDDGEVAFDFPDKVIKPLARNLIQQTADIAASNPSQEHNEQAFIQKKIAGLLKGILFDVNSDAVFLNSKHYCIAKFLNDNSQQLEKLMPNFPNQKFQFHEKERSIDSILKKYTIDAWSASHLVDMVSWINPELLEEYEEVSAEDQNVMMQQEIICGASEEYPDFPMIDMYAKTFLYEADIASESARLISLELPTVQSLQVQNQGSAIEKAAKDLERQVNSRTEKTGAAFKKLKALIMKPLSENQVDQEYDLKRSIESNIEAGHNEHDQRPCRLSENIDVYRSDMERRVPDIQGFPLTNRQKKAINRKEEWVNFSEHFKKNQDADEVDKKPNMNQPADGWANIRQSAATIGQHIKSVLQNVVVKPARSIGQRVYATFSEIRPFYRANIIGFDLQQRTKENGKLKAIVDLRTTPQARVSGPTLTNVNKVKVIIGPNQQAILCMRSKSQYMERTIVNQTPEPIVARHYWDALTPNFKAKVKGGGDLRPVNEKTVVTLDNLNTLQPEGIYALVQDKDG